MPTRYTGADSSGKFSVFKNNEWTNDSAGFQQYALSNAVDTGKISENVSFDEAATLPVGIATALVGYYSPQPHGAGLVAPFDPSTQGKYTGKPLLILGGATSVGQFAIQLGKLSGFSPIITTASIKHEVYLKSLGATHVLDRRLSTASLDAEIRKITSSPIGIVYDTVSLHDTQATGYSILADGGSLILTLDPKVDAVEGKNIVHVYGSLAKPFSKELGAKFHSVLPQLLKTGELKPNKVEVLPGGLAGIVDGLERLENDQVSGVKLVVRPQETI
ncbi:hypothetical protein H0H87_008972 [Tephrocybe sp. NHM501043]|nr:hypothetical protein H0H87_008972 [Tephrocybe sp. NHM501043]